MMQARANGDTGRLGISGSIAAAFQQARITPLLAIALLLLGAFALMVTPREEEPQIDVTMVNVFIPFPGASARDVESMVAGPAEQVLGRIPDVEHVMSVSRPGLALVTVQFEVGVSRTEAVVRVHDTLASHADWLPAGLGVLPPLVRPKGIDDVPIVTLTLFTEDGSRGPYDLERIAHSIQADLKRVPGTRDVTVIGGPGRAVMVEIEPARMAALGVTVADLRRALVSANAGLPAGDLLAGNRSIAIEAGGFLRDAEEVAGLLVRVHEGRPVFVGDVAEVREGAPAASRYVWHGVDDDEGQGMKEHPAVTLAITKKPGKNAIDVARAVLERVQDLRNTVVPADVQVAETRNYGATAQEKARQLIQKLLFATVSVVALVFVALGRREAAIVGSAVVLTLAATLFASWAWGFTLNRVSLFALIFSIGILVDDAIVVVENIHRHQGLHPGRSLPAIIPAAVDEVGGPTILATFTVIAALLPMAFVTGLMGPYMSPIPINASMGMFLSLVIAFVVTPWLANRWMRAAPPPAQDEGPSGASPGAFTRLVRPLLERAFRPLLDARRGARNRRLLGLAVVLLITASMALPLAGLVVLKMLPFDNKSEFQVVVDMPEGTPVERTAAVLQALGAHLLAQPEVTSYQAYAGTASPMNFNGLVRQYDLREGGEVGDLQVSLVDRRARDEQSHAIATRLRPALQEIGRRMGANVKVVEVPPGPPVLSPIVAEVYGPDAAGRDRVTAAVREAFEGTPGVVDVDDTRVAVAPRTVFAVDRRKAAMLGISQQDIVATLRAGLAGEATAYLHDQSRRPAAAVLQLPPERHGDIEALLQLGVRGANGAVVPVRELVTAIDSLREQPIHHKDLLPVAYVTADMAGDVDSPLYGMFRMREAIARIEAPGGGPLRELFIRQPDDPWRDYSIKWDGEWQITYETFRDMGLAYAVGLVLIYLLGVAQFGSYLVPLVIMAPIPLTLIGVLPGHALLGAQFTATSMIGMIALAGIIVRNSILLVDFANLLVRAGMPFEEAIVRSAVTRAQPIALTGVAAMLGAFFILDDPIFNGLVVSLVFGILVSTLLTLVVIPVLYYVAYRNRLAAILAGGHDAGPSTAGSGPLPPDVPLTL